MKPVKAVDAAFLQLETRATPMHVGAVFILDPGSPPACRTFFRRFRSEVGKCLGRSEVFTRRIAPLPLGVANPMWVTGAPDLDYHVRRTVLPAPGSLHQLDQRVADLHTPLMDRNRPLWELHVIEGLDGGRVALYIKTHHAGLDGASAQLFLRSFVDTEPRPRRRRAAPAPEPEHVTARDLLLAGAGHQLVEWRRLAGAASGLARQLPGGLGNAWRLTRAALPELVRRGLPSVPRTPLNVAIGSGRNFATVEYPLERVKSVARTHDATINDVILAACAGALRRWLLAHDALPAEPLTTAVPFSTREPGDSDHSIQVSFITIGLHTDVEDAHARLQAIHRSAAEAKFASQTIKSMMPGDLPSIGLPWLLGSLAHALSIDAVFDRLPLPANLVISNVAGPPTPLYVAGARALTYSPVSIPYHGCALNVTVYSYDGRLYFGLTAARRVIPDLRDLAAWLKVELELLASNPRAPRTRRRHEPPARKRSTGRR